MAEKAIVRSVRNQTSSGSRAKGFSTGRDVITRQLRNQPRIEVPETREVDYEFYRRLSSGLTDNPLTEAEFNQLAGSRAVPQFRQRVDNLNRQQFEQDQTRAAIEQKYGSVDRQQAFQEELTGRIRKTQEDLVRVGQHDETTAVDFRNIAETAAVLLSVEGEDEDSVAARRYGAQILSEHGARLAPHLEVALGPNWLQENQDKINTTLEETEPQGFDKVKDWGSRALGAVLDFPAVRLPLDTLQQMEQAWFRGAYSGAKAIDPTTSMGERIDYLKDVGATAARGAGSIVSLGQADFGFDPASTITVGDRQVSLDVDESGDVNLRELIGIDPETGGLAGDAADLVGTILLDPTTYLSLGAKPASRLVATALSESSDPLARRVGVQLANGAKLRNLDDVSQAAARSEFLRYQIDAVGNPRNRQLVFSRFNKSPGDVIRVLRGEADSTDRLIDNLINSRTRRMTKAAERGVFPAVRIGGRTVIPMRKLYNALGIIDTRLASDDAWARRAVQMAEIEDTGELLHFIQTYSGQEMTEELRQQMNGWSSMATLMDESSEEWLDDLLQRTAAGAEDEAFDQIEAFGRSLLGDTKVADWRDWYTNRWAGRRVTDPNLPRGTQRLELRTRDALEVPGDKPLRRVVAELDPDQLSDVAKARIRYNLDVFNEPLQWMAKDGIMTRGLRSVAAKDTLIGNLLRRVSDSLSPRAGIRRTGDLGTQAARDVENLEVMMRARRELVTDHVAKLDIDRTGTSKLYQRADKEVTGSLDELLNRVLSSSPDEIDDHLRRLELEGSTNTARLIRTLEEIRQDIFDLSVAAGADEEALLALKGYLPRTVSEEATRRVQRAAIPGSSTASELPELQRLGLEPDQGAVSARSPLAQRGSLERRSFERDLQDLYEVNAEAREQLREAGLDGVDGFDLYEADPIRAMLLRSRSAHEARAWMDMVRGMADLTDMNGRPLAYIANNADEIADTAVRRASHDATFGKANYLRRELPNGGEYWVRKEILDEIERVNNVIRDPQLMNSFRRVMTKWNDIWGAWATVPIVGGFGFHARNATGNIFNMIVAGARNPGVLADAARLQRVHHRAMRALREGAADYPAALRSLGVDEGTVELLRDARKYGILGSGQVADIFTATDALAGGRRSLNPLDQSNLVLRSGRNLGQTIESNARLGLFIDGRTAKGMNSKDAAERVRTYLFDYNDLTPFESNNARMLARFYTFARKNTALQARMMITQPGRVHNAQRIVEEITNQVMGVFGFDEEGQPVPGLRESGEKIPSWVQPTLGLYRNEEGELVVAGADSPLGAAAEVIDGLSAIMKLPPAFAWMLSAEDGREREQRGEAFRDTIGEALGLLSGGPVEGVKTAFEYGTDRDLFVGGKLSDVDRNWLDSLFRITDTVIPIMSKLDREAEYTGIYSKLGILQDEERTDRSQGSMRLLNTLGGLTYVPGLSDPDRITSNMRSLSYELDAGIEEATVELADQGIEVPTFDEWLEAGGYYTRDRAIEFLIYKTLDGEPLTIEERQDLRGFVPKAVLEAAGFNVPDAERAEWNAQERARRVREITTALQAQGIDVTQEMIDALVLRESGARLSDVKELGIEPSFQRNPWMDAANPEAANRQRQQQSLEQLEALAGLLGVSIKELQERYPVLQPAERLASQMAEAGYSQNEIAQELISGLSRQEQALIFGEGSLEQTYAYEALTADEVLDFQRKAARKDAELRVIMQVVLGRQPTQYELDEWLSETLFLAPEQRKLGFDNYSPPRRENLTTDAVYDERLRQKVEATRSVSDFLGQ